ncbi:MAG: hypothetical protein HDR46_05250 [Bacteroides sp.]|nr:hypothetical protein [Bacteroides sp.]
MANKFDNLVDNENKTTSSSNDNSSQLGTYQSLRDKIYTKEEQLDVNAITVTIPDRQTPIVVFFGSPSSGKTLALLRMIQFFESHNHQVVPEEVFRPKTDDHYTEMCANLKNLVNDQYTPGGTDIISFMLVKVLDQAGHPVCQILEAPGEHYFDGSANLNFPTYINAIRTAPNRKVWVFFVEQGWGKDQTERNLYAQKIRSMQNLISPNDKVVFLFNKVDKYLSHNQFDSNNRPIISSFFQNISNQYPGIFDKYRNSGLLKVLYGPYRFKAVCFSSGTFNETSGGREVWTRDGDDWYCEELWKAIK